MMSNHYRYCTVTPKELFRYVSTQRMRQTRKKPFRWAGLRSHGLNVSIVKSSHESKATGSQAMIPIEHLVLYPILRSVVRYNSWLKQSPVIIMKIQILLTLIFASLTSAFQWNPPGNWIEDEGTSSLAGQCVKNSMDGQIIAVSAPYYSPEDTPGLRFGRVVIYTFDEVRDAWDKLGGDITGEEGDSFGSSLGMSEDWKMVIVGSLNDNKNGVQAGMVQVFVFDDISGDEKWIQKGQTLSTVLMHLMSSGTALILKMGERLLLLGHLVNIVLMDLLMILELFGCTNGDLLLDGGNR